MRPRWLPEFPNYREAREVEELATSIDEFTFVDRFVLKHQPAVIRGAASHWRAISIWTSDYLRSATCSSGVIDQAQSRRVDVSLEPLVEEVGPVLLAPRTNKMSMAAFLDLIDERWRPFVQCYYAGLELFRPVVRDLGSLTFLDTRTRRPRLLRDRLFISRAGYTDWHAHPADETLTIQLRGAKEVLLLPPDPATYRAVLPAARRGVWKLPRACWDDDFRALVPWRATLHAGDALYIPMNWWHAAEAMDDEFNVTFAKVFCTPVEWQADLRLPNVRRSMMVVTTGAMWATATTRSLAPLEDAARMLLVMLVGFPVSIFTHPRVRSWRGRTSAKSANFERGS